MEEDARTLGAQRLSREESQDEGEGGSTKTNDVWKSLTETLNQKAHSKIKLKRKEFAQWYPVWMDNVAPRRYGLLKEKSSENAHWDRIPPQTPSPWLHLASGIGNHSNIEGPHSSQIWVEKEHTFAWLLFIQQLETFGFLSGFVFLNNMYILFYGHMGFACLFLCALHACKCLQKPEEGIVSLETGVTDSWKEPCGW